MALPHIPDIMGKLQSITGLKYFRLFWASQRLDSVLLRLHDIVSPSGQPTAVSHILRSISVVDRPAVAETANDSFPPLLPAGPTPSGISKQFSVSLSASVSRLYCKQLMILQLQPCSEVYYTSSVSMLLSNNCQCLTTCFQHQPFCFPCVCLHLQCKAAIHAKHCEPAMHVETLNCVLYRSLMSNLISNLQLPEATHQQPSTLLKLPWFA